MEDQNQTEQANRSSRVASLFSGIASIGFSTKVKGEELSIGFLLTAMGRATINGLK